MTPYQMNTTAHTLFLLGIDEKQNTTDTAHSEAAKRGWITRREPRGCVYLLKNLVSDKCYVGQTLNFEHRWLSHLRDAFVHKSQYPIHRALRKYGELKFSRTVIHVCAASRLDDAEIRFIKKMRTHVSQRGYNQTWGGDGVKGLVFSKASRTQLSNSLKRYYVENPDAVERLRARHTGRIHSSETKAKITAANTGRTLSKNTRRALSVSAKKRWADPVHRAVQVSGMQNQRNNPVIQRNRSDGAKRRYADPEERRRTAQRTKAAWERAGYRERLSVAISAGMQEVVKTPAYKTQMSLNRLGRKESV